MKRACFKCRGRLEPITYGGVEVNRCDHCAGIWFDSLEADLLKNIQGSESLDIGDPETGQQYDQTPGNLSCPRCNHRLIRMVDIDEHSIWYEKCPRCQGVWLDAGEFKKFKANFQPKSLGQFARKILGHKARDSG
ncbi:MAG: zf-TFIIB domain-containing protein [Chloroflexaceae bacterium]|nr:zf-TFIIB domain-containing protein [Chloroflexaceae bacterium]